jgi:purine-binding chemotaxis protein CheW
MADQEMIYLEEEAENESEHKYLLFKLGDEEYGINITMVQSIEEMQTIVAVPDMPDYVKGVINLRGQVIPVLDLRINFNMEEREYDDRTCMVITRISETNMGLIVDTVSEVVDIPAKSIEPPPQFKSDSRREHYIAGIGKVEDEVKILLDVSKLLRGEEVEEIRANAPEAK